MKRLSLFLLTVLFLNASSCAPTNSAKQTASSPVTTALTRTDDPTVEPAWDGDATNWMAKLPDETLLYDITIPGTHDSGASRDDFLGKFAQCQSLSIAEQLSCGVRFFDIRLKLIGDSLDVYHSIVDQQLTFETVRRQCKDFLADHPDEVILLCIKEEDDNNAGFAKAVEKAIQADGDLWYTENALPTLGEARGKIVLFRRFGGSSQGINCANGWWDNTDFTLNNGVTIHVQDYYRLETTSNIKTKWSKIETHMKKAYRTDALCINFASGYTGMVDITSVSNEINPKLTEYFTGQQGAYGTILCDFVTPALASLLIATNF